MWSAIFYLEFLRTGRRFRLQVARGLFALWLLLMLAINAGTGRAFLFPLSLVLPQGANAPAADTLIVQQLLLIVLTVPAFAAGAITEEKALGTLPDLLSTSLTPWQILVGKFVSRSAQVGMVALTALPLLCYFGGLPPTALVAAGTVSLGLIGPLAALGLLASVWVRTGGAAVMLTYAVAGLAAVLVRWGGGPLRCLDPLYVLEPALTLRGLDEVSARLAAALALWSALTVGLLALAAWRLRPAYTRQFMESRPAATATVRGRRRPVGDDGLRWKERYVGGLAVVPLLRRLPRWSGVAVTAAVSTLVSLALLEPFLPSGVTLRTLAAAGLRGDIRAVGRAVGGMDSPALAFLGLGMGVVLIAGVAINVRAAGSVSGEREKGTWDMLLLAGLGPRAMLRSKLLGIVESSYPYLLAFAVPAILVGALGGVLPPLAVVGCLLLTWPAMYLAAAMALERSARYPSAWRSIVEALPLTAIMVGAVAYGPLYAAGLFVVVFFVINRGSKLGALGTVVLAGVFTLTAGVAGWLMIVVANSCLRSARAGLVQGGEFGAFDDRGEKGGRRRHSRRPRSRSEESPVTSPKRRED
jgi:ABC-type transport system involved in multi-copper enzyme maturation permease subunit